MPERRSFDHEGHGTADLNIANGEVISRLSAQHAADFRDFLAQTDQQAEPTLPQPFKRPRSRPDHRIHLLLVRPNLTAGSLVAFVVGIFICVLH